MRQLIGSHHTDISLRRVKNVGDFVEQVERKHHYGKKSGLTSFMNHGIKSMPTAMVGY